MPYRHDPEDRSEPGVELAFRGYAPPTSSTTYTPNQFFDVVLPHASRGCLRLVAYLIRKTLGWSDEEGNPQNPEAFVSYRELIERAGISRGAIKDAIQEALDKRFIQCLRFGQPHRPNEEGFSALYSLKWDEREVYIADPDEFDGFFAGNGNLTHIPNDFFDYTIPNEPLAVIQVIGVIIRNTIGWQTKHGMRRQRIELSFSDIMRRTGIGSRTTVSKALGAAIGGCHIRRVEHGYFDRHAGAESKATVYAIRWADEEERRPDFEQPTLFESDFGIGSKSGPGNQSKNWTEKSSVQKVDRSSTVQKVDRGDSSKSGPAIGSETGPATVQEVDSDEFKKQTDIKTTNLNNPSKQHQTAPDGDVGGSVSLALLIGKLLSEGIEPEAAARLASTYPGERILRQLEWISMREVKSSRTGLLIRAIERDMPRPGVQTSERSRGWHFAAAFYAELQGNSEEPVADPGSEEGRLGEVILARILEAPSPEVCGREFARHVLAAEKGKASPVRTLGLAARLFADSFVARRNAEARKDAETKAARARAAHEEKYQAAYREFLHSESLRLMEDDRLLQAFDDDARQRVRRAYALSPTAGKRREAIYDDAAQRAEAFLEFAEANGSIQPPNFWDWDATINTEPFSTEGKP